MYSSGKTRLPRTVERPNVISFISDIGNDVLTLWRADEAINLLGIARLITDDGPTDWTTGFGQHPFAGHSNPFVFDQCFVAGRSYSRFSAPAIRHIAAPRTVGCFETSIPCRECAIAILLRCRYSGCDRCLGHKRSYPHDAGSLATTACRRKSLTGRTEETQIGH